mgnify:CR=1 FL=1|jgi:hypothetical protein
MDHFVKNLTNRESSTAEIENVDVELLASDLIITPRAITPYTQLNLHATL